MEAATKTDIENYRRSCSIRATAKIAKVSHETMRQKLIAAGEKLRKPGRIRCTFRLSNAEIAALESHGKQIRTKNLQKSLSHILNANKGL